MVWMKVVATVVAGGALAVAGVGAAEAKTPAACAALFGKNNKVIQIKKGGVHLPTHAHKNGWVVARNAKFHPGGDDDGHYAPTGKKHTRYFAAKATICVLKNGSPNWTKVKVKGLRTTVNTTVYSPFYTVAYNGKGRIKTLVEQFHP